MRVEVHYGIRKIRNRFEVKYCNVSRNLKFMKEN